MNKTIKKYLIMILGAMSIGVGVAFIVYGDIGGDSLTTLEQGLSRTFEITIPTSQILVNGLFVVALFLLDRRKVSFDTILSPLVISSSCNIALKLVLMVETMLFRIIYLLIGIVIIGIGIGIGAQSESGLNPYDGVVLSLSEKFKVKFSLLRPILDLIVLIIGILLKGSWGIGTIITILTQGFIADFFIKIFKKLIK